MTGSSALHLQGINATNNLSDLGIGFFPEPPDEDSAWPASWFQLGNALSGEPSHVLWDL